MKIFVSSLKLNVIIGALDFERLKPQNIEVDIEIEYQNKFIDYAKVRELIKKYFKEEKFIYLEDAIRFISQKLKTIFPQIISIFICIKKLEIFNDCCVGAKEKIFF